MGSVAFELDWTFKDVIPWKEDLEMATSPPFPASLNDPDSDEDGVFYICAGRSVSSNCLNISVRCREIKRKLNAKVIIRILSVRGSERERTYPVVFVPISKSVVEYGHPNEHSVADLTLSRDELQDPTQHLLTGSDLKIEVEMNVYSAWDRIAKHAGLKPPPLTGVTGIPGMADLQANFKQMRLDKTTSDFTIISQEGREFKVHKCVLKARSNVFVAMLEHNLEEARTGRCKVDDVDGETMDIFLAYLYGDIDQDRIQEHAEPLLVVANKYERKDLKDICVSHLLYQVNVDNAAQLLILADTYSLDELKEEILNFLSQGNVPEFVERGGYEVLLESRPDLLKKLLTSCCRWL